MHIWCSAVIAREFRIDPASMAEGTGLPFVFLDKGVPFDQPRIDAADGGALHVALSARSMTRSARFLEDLFAEDFFFRFQKIFLIYRASVLLRCSAGRSCNF